MIKALLIGTAFVIAFVVVVGIALFFIASIQAANKDDIWRRS